MANILSDTDFKGFLFIDFTNETLKSDFNNNFLPKIEEKYLRYLLGHSLYNEFIAGLNVTEPEEIAQKWIDLRDGADFTVEINSKNVALHFDGVKELLKHFAWSAYQTDLQVKYTSSGAKINISDNSEISKDYRKSFDVYNKAVSKYGDNVIGFVDGANDIEFFQDYSDLENRTTFASKYKDAIITNSAYNFIYHKEKEISGTYQNWLFTPLFYSLIL